MGHATHSGERGSVNYPASGTWTTINIYPYLNVNLNLNLNVLIFMCLASAGRKI